MIKFENTEVMGWEAAIRGMRNPMNSWEKSDSCTRDSTWCSEVCGNSECNGDTGLRLGSNDLDLMRRLAAGGPVHSKYRRMITVYVDITAPLYWWKEFSTYKVGTVENSCSTMHKIAAKGFTLEDFSTEHFITADNDDPMDAYFVGNTRWGSNDVMNITLKVLNYYRNRYLKTKDKKYWWQMIQLLPSSYNQKRTVMMNYEALANIYKSRKDHKLDEWAEHKAEMIDVTTSEDLVNGDHRPHLVEGVKEYFGFCDWIKTLPYSELITGKEV